MEIARTLLRPFGYFKSPVEVPTDVKAAIEALDLDDINRILFRCDQEERSDGFGLGSYTLNNVGPMLYCGLQGNVHFEFYFRDNALFLRKCKRCGSC